MLPGQAIPYENPKKIRVNEEPFKAVPGVFEAQCPESPRKYPDSSPGLSGSLPRRCHLCQLSLYRLGPIPRPPDPKSRFTFGFAFGFS